MDGVLLRSDELYAEIAYSLFDREILASEMSRFVTKGGEELFAAVIGDDTSEEKIKLFRRAQIDYFHPEKHLYDGVLQFFLKLGVNYDCAILSNKPEHIIRQILKKCGIEHMFSSVIGLDSGFKKKPSPEGARFLVENSNCTKSIFVGDAYSDWLTANRVGIDFVYAAYGFDTNTQPHLFEMTKFSELSEIIAKNF